MQPITHTVDGREIPPTAPFRVITDAALSAGWTLQAQGGQAGWGPGQQEFAKDGKTLAVRYAGPGHPSAAQVSGEKLPRKALQAAILTFLAGK